MPGFWTRTRYPFLGCTLWLWPNWILSDDGCCLLPIALTPGYPSPCKCAVATLHGVLPVSYYRAVIERKRAQVASPFFLIFSDDHDWCRANLPLGPEEVVFVDHNRGADPWQDLVLMSCCRHHVVVNSSFSSWGAWLADQRYRGAPRYVIAPARWFAGQTHDIADRFPAHWTVLP